MIKTPESWEIQAKRYKRKPREANRDSSRETQAEMKFGRGADRTTCYGTECDYVLRHAEGLTSDATRRRVAEKHADEVTPDATRRRVAEEHAGGSVDIRCDSTACGRRARG